MCKLREKPVGRKPCQTSSCKVWETGNWNVVSYPEAVNVAKHASGKYVIIIIIIELRFRDSDAGFK